MMQLERLKLEDYRAAFPKPSQFRLISTGLYSHGAVRRVERDVLTKLRQCRHLVRLTCAAKYVFKTIDRHLNRQGQYGNVE